MITRIRKSRADSSWLPTAQVLRWIVVGYDEKLATSMAPTPHSAVSREAMILRHCLSIIVIVPNEPLSTSSNHCINHWLIVVIMILLPDWSRRMTRSSY